MTNLINISEETDEAEETMPRWTNGLCRQAFILETGVRLPYVVQNIK